MMKIAFFSSDKPRERILADAVLKGAAKHGHETLLVPLGQELEPGSYDVICICGVKSIHRWHAHRRAGTTMVMFDKGYSRDNRTGAQGKWEYWRVSVNAHHPTDRLMSRDYPADRWNRLGLEIKPWRKRGHQIVIAGSSEKYHSFEGLDDPTGFATGIVEKIRKRGCARPIVYRPKPSWDGAVKIPDTIWSSGRETIQDVLRNAWCLVTHGSNACFEAMLAGIPTIILGNAVTRPISTTSLALIESPKCEADPARLKLACALAYHQWTKPEFTSGLAWEYLLAEIYDD